MATPWFFIRCPACEGFWGERGSFPPDGSLVTPCLHCGRDISIEFVIGPNGALAIASVIDFSTMRHGDWSPLLDARVHRREVN